MKKNAAGVLEQTQDQSEGKSLLRSVFNNMKARVPVALIVGEHLCRRGC